MTFGLYSSNLLYSPLKGTLVTYGVHKSTCLCVCRPPTLLILASSVSLFASNRFWAPPMGKNRARSMLTSHSSSYHECPQCLRDNLSRPISQGTPDWPNFRRIELRLASFARVLCTGCHFFFLQGCLVPSFRLSDRRDSQKKTNPVRELALFPSQRETTPRLPLTLHLCVHSRSYHNKMLNFIKQIR